MSGVTEMVTWRRNFAVNQSSPGMAMKLVSDCEGSVADNYVAIGAKRGKKVPTSIVQLGEWSIAGWPCRDWSRKNMQRRNDYTSSVKEHKGKSAKAFHSMNNAWATHDVLIGTGGNVFNLVCVCCVGVLLFCKSTLRMKVIVMC